MQNILKALRYLIFGTIVYLSEAPFGIEGLPYLFQVSLSFAML